MSSQVTVEGLVLSMDSEWLLEGASQVRHPAHRRYSINIQVKNV